MSGLKRVNFEELEEYLKEIEEIEMLKMFSQESLFSGIYFSTNTLNINTKQYVALY